MFVLGLLYREALILSLVHSPWPTYDGLRHQMPAIVSAGAKIPIVPVENSPAP